MKLVFASTVKVFALALYLYTTKSSMGINLVKECHAWEVMLGQCDSVHFQI
jgi:hypothetical protein